MASFELREPKKKPRYYKLIANVLVNGKIERRYGRFDFDPTELKNARARNAAAKAAAAEFERLEQEKADKEASNAGKTFAVVAQEYIESKKARLAPSARLEGDYDSHRNKANTTRGKETTFGRFSNSLSLHRSPLIPSKRWIVIGFWNKSKLAAHGAAPMLLSISVVWR